MNKCLVTKLNGSSNNSELLRLGEMRIKITKVESPTDSTQGFGIQANKPVTLQIIGEGYFTDKDLTANKGKTIVIDTNYTGIWVSSNDVEIAILDKYSIIDFTSVCLNQASGTKVENKIINITDLKYSLLLNRIDLYKSKASGDIVSLKNLTALTSLSLGYTQLSGDIVSLKNLTALTNLSLGYTQVSGDIVSLKNLTALTSLNLGYTQVSGDIVSLKNLTALTFLSLSSTQVSGDIENLKNLTALTSLNFYTTKVSGDIVSLKNLTALTSLNLGYTQVSGDIENLKNLTALTSLDLSSTQVNGDLAAFTLLVKCATFYLQGNTFTGDLSKLPSVCRYASFVKNKNTVLTWTNRPSTAKIIAIAGNAKITNVDKMLQDQAQCQVGFTASSSVLEKTISCVGTRTSASDTAVNALQQKGYTVSITPA